MIDDARKLGSRGMAISPCKGKIPLTPHGCLDATTDIAQIETWWAQWPDANIAIATGPRSGIWVLDIDADKGGEESIKDLEQKHFAIPPTVESITGGGGRHLFFRLPDFDEAPEIKNSVGKLAPGIDVRGDGGYVIAPPSIHPDSKRAYRWSVDCASEFADAPVWLIALIARAQFNVIEMPKMRDDDWLAIVRDGVAEGSRNDSAASLSGYLLRRGVHAKVTFELLLAWDARNKPPLGEAVIERTVVSIAEKEIARRRMRPQRPTSGWGKGDNPWKTKR
jgi:hypothetical protein